jgi:hypothetical protein
MRLESVYSNPESAAPLLYALLSERSKEIWISHERMPTHEEHRRFIAGRPFLHWHLIVTDVEDVECNVGAIEATDRNELGVSILKMFQRRGYGRAALRLFVQEYQPLPAIPAVRNGRWLANIATSNIGSKLFFAELGFRPLQETWIAPQGPAIPAHLISDDATGVLTRLAPWEIAG